MQRPLQCCSGTAQPVQDRIWLDVHAGDVLVCWRPGSSWRTAALVATQCAMLSPMSMNHTRVGIGPYDPIASGPHLHRLCPAAAVLPPGLQASQSPSPDLLCEARSCPFEAPEAPRLQQVQLAQQAQHGLLPAAAQVYWCPSGCCTIPLFISNQVARRHGAGAVCAFSRSFASALRAQVCRGPWDYCTIALCISDQVAERHGALSMCSQQVPWVQQIP